MPDMRPGKKKKKKGRNAVPKCHRNWEKDHCQNNKNYEQKVLLL